MPRSQQGFVSILTLILIIVLFIMMGGTYFYFQTQPAVQQQLPRSLILPTRKPAPTPGLLRSYINQTLGFSFNYPNDWQLQESKDTNGSTSYPIAHIVLQLKPGSFTGSQVPIKLIYWDNPNKLSWSDLEKKINGLKTNPMPIIYSGSDDYVLTGSGLTANLRNNGTCEDKNCQIYTFSDADKVYQLESFLNANIYNQKNVLDQIVNSFKFADFVSGNIKGASTSANSKR